MPVVSITSISDSETSSSSLRDVRSEKSLSPVAESAASELPDVPPRSGAKSVLIAAICAFAMILNTSNTTSVTIALPTIGRDLNIKQTQLQWLSSAYALSSGCMLLFIGRLADLYGRKLTFVIGIGVIGIFALGCSFAQDDTTIFVLRGLQGIGGAASVPAALGILARRFPPSEARGRAFATFAAGSPIGAGFGTIVGSILTQFTAKSWRSTFYLTFGISMLIMVGGMFVIDPDVPPDVQDRRVDWIGAVLVTSGLVLIIFVLSDGSIAPAGWKTPYIIALLIAGVLLVALFLAWQAYLERTEARHAPDMPRTVWNPPPLMRLSVWRRAHGKLAVILAVYFLEWCSFTTFAFWIELYYQNFRHFSPIQTMLRLIPMPVTGLLCNVVVALFISRIPLVLLIAFGTSATSLACVLLALIRAASPYWAFGFPAAILSVFGADFVLAAGSLFVAKASPAAEQSVNGALLQTAIQLGNTFGLAASTLVFSAALTRASSSSSSATATATAAGAYKAAMWAGCGFGGGAAVLAVLFLRGVGPVGHSHTRAERLAGAEVGLKNAEAEVPVQVEK